MRLVFFLSSFFLAAAAFGQGSTTADYYQYQRDQAFKKYMETTGSKGMAGSIKTNFNSSLDKKATDDFFELIRRRNQGNKVVETEAEKKAIRQRMEMDKMDAKIKADNAAEENRARNIGMSAVRTLTFRDGRIFEGYYYGKRLNDTDPLFMTLVSGKMTHTDGGVYVGGFAQHYGISYKWEYGIMNWPDGEMYSGEWRKDAYHGYGKFKRRNGDVYEGQFERGLYHGFGRLVHADGKVQEGFWSDGVFTGDEPPIASDVAGKDLSKKEVDGRRRSGHGKGRIRGLRGLYKGEFKNYNMHGKGTIEFDNGGRFTGDFFYDAIQGKGIQHFYNGEVYEGSYIMNKRNGRGTYRSPDGSVYEGEWKDNQREGKGIMRWSNGDIYEGEWVNNNPTGLGKKTYADGRVDQGGWKDGKRIRENVSIYNWETAAKENWTALRVPETDINIQRSLQDGQLKFKTKTGNYIWGWTDLDKAKPESYEYELVYEIKKEGFKNGQGGILIEIDEGNAPNYSKLLYMIQPDVQTFYLGMYNDAKREWTSLTSPSANGGWVHSSTVNAFTASGISTNKLRLTKAGDAIMIYLNDKLVFTQNINASGRPLDKFSGIGIVQGGFLEGSITSIRFN